MINNPALGGSTLSGMRGADFLSKLIPAVMGAIFVAGVVVFLFTFLLGAIGWISSGGDKGKIEGAKQKLTNALIGIVVLLGFFAILSFIECFFGIGLRGIQIGSFNVSLTGNAVCTGSGGGTTAPTNAPTAAPTTGGKGTIVGGSTGNTLCSGCFNNGCGITGQIYLGTGTQNYSCTTKGWVSTSQAVTSTTCGTCQ